MEIVTSWMKEGIKKGREEGIKAGREEGIKAARHLVLKLLARRVGRLPRTTSTAVRSLDLAALQSLGEALLDFERLEDLRRWLAARR